ncbi:hypothetical protein SAMD00024442_28_25 [Candidatus Symbiothrix dinenymphae]|nr:hypothetical protein SAMD00024442_28_25 [Candidatus Symbiothrix dinenymphae]
MSEKKITIQILAAKLAEKSKITVDEAESFLTEWSDAITDGLFTDESVKIKGLGTLKLVDVKERTSIAVGTGHPMVIPAHYKITFTPDKALADSVNAPFEGYASITIGGEDEDDEEEKLEREENPDLIKQIQNDIAEIQRAKPEQLAPVTSYQLPVTGVIEEVEEKIEEIEEKIEKIEEKLEEKIEEIEEEDLSAIFEPIGEKPQEVKVEKTVVEAPVEKERKIALSEPLEDRQIAYMPPKMREEFGDRKKTKKKKTMKEEEFEDDELYDEEEDEEKGSKGTLIIIILLLLLIAGGGFVFRDTIKQKFFADDSGGHGVDTLHAVEEENSGVVDSLRMDSIMHAAIVRDSLEREAAIRDSLEREAMEQTVQKPIVESNVSSSKYRTKKGDHLADIARKRYGHQIFWIYIYQENERIIKDPDHLKPGIVIKLPPKSKYEIDAKDGYSLKKARDMIKYQFGLEVSL